MWVRKGECSQCGECCKHIGVWFDLTPETKPFLKLLQVRGISVKGDNGKVLADFPQDCQHLKENKCDLHGKKRRPEFCSEWPTHPSQIVLHPKCSYTFEWEEEKE